MAYQSIHTGPEIDAAATLLDDIQEIRDESNANKDTVVSLAAQVATDANRTEAAAMAVDGVVEAAELARDDAVGFAANADTARAQAVVARNGAEAAATEAEQYAQDASNVAAGNVFDDSQVRTDRGWTSHKLSGLFDAINAILASDDTNLDELQEIVEYIKLNRDELDNLSIASIAGLQTALDNKQPLSTVLTSTTASFTTALLSKLEGIAAEATKNATDAQLRDRSTHTGTQAASTITGLATVATSGSYNDLSDKPTIPTLPTLATVATSGSYDDLSNKPSIPAIPGNATPSSSGLMSAGDKAKLDQVGTMANRNATISSGDPSGGGDGDVWFKVE